MTVPATRGFAPYLGPLENRATEMANDVLGQPLSQFDFVIYCMPAVDYEVMDLESDGTGGSAPLEHWTSEGYGGLNRALLMNEACEDPSHLMRVIGRGLLGMTGEEDNMGMMGPSLLADEGDEGPRMCYDPVNSYSTGWYGDFDAIANVSASNWGGNLTGISDVAEGRAAEGTHTSILQIFANKTGEHLYVSFNRADGVNADTASHADHVVVMQYPDDPDGEVEVIMSLSKTGSELVMNNFDDSGHTLSVRTCDHRAGTITDPDEVGLVVNLLGVLNRTAVPCPGDPEPAETTTTSSTTTTTTTTSTTSAERSSTTSTPNVNCQDSLTMKATYDGLSWTCEQLAIITRSDPTYLEWWCTDPTSTAPFICQATCEQFGIQCSPLVETNVRGPGGFKVHCEDEPGGMATMKVEGTHETLMKSCFYIARMGLRSPSYLDDWCHEDANTNAREVCPKTCGLCD